MNLNYTNMLELIRYIVVITVVAALHLKDSNAPKDFQDIILISPISHWTFTSKFLTCSLIVRLHKYIICFDLEMYFLIDNNMTTTVVVINKLMHLVKF